MTCWIHPDAETELGDAAACYAAQASPAIAEAFLAEYERIRDLIIENQRLGTHADGDLRVLHFDRFPYTLVYEENQTHGPQIYAVAHQSREPGYWVGRT